MKEFIAIIMNGLTPSMFFAYSVYALIGLFVFLIMDVWTRNVHSQETPISFSWNHWWMDNRVRIILSVVSIPIFVLISNAVLGQMLDLHNAFTIGFGVDAIFNTLKKKGLYGAKK